MTIKTMIVVVRNYIVKKINFLKTLNKQLRSD